MFCRFRQEALEAAISERDAQLGLLEVSGIKTARAAERADDLRSDRKRLMQLMKQQVWKKYKYMNIVSRFQETNETNIEFQNEIRVKLLLEYEENLPGRDADHFQDQESTEESDDDPVVCK